MTENEIVEYFQLEEVAEQVGLSAARIRAYERAGLIAPSLRRGRKRYYRKSEMARLRRLRRLATDLGLNAAGVEVVARLLDEMDALRAEVHALRGEWETSSSG
ncbi:MAG TPA: chaperone modulator CbpM [Chloroflexota bacterium]|jgi:MerR family transcriptional regulator/heat shock protein HspR|nr:chaperone modulator CbpM [Chloroflexota bacterium]